MVRSYPTWDKAIGISIRSLILNHFSSQLVGPPAPRPWRTRYSWPTSRTMGFGNNVDRSGQEICVALHCQVGHVGQAGSLQQGPSPAPRRGQSAGCHSWCGRRFRSPAPPVIANEKRRHEDRAHPELSAHLVWLSQEQPPELGRLLFHLPLMARRAIATASFSWDARARRAACDLAACLHSRLVPR